MARAAVDIIDTFSAKVFFEGYYRRTPAVIPKRILHWRAMQLWSPAYFANRFGDTLVTIARYDPEANESFVDQTLADVHETIPLRDFAVSLVSGDRRYALREDKKLLKRFPELLDDLDHLRPFSSANYFAQNLYSSLWIGPAGYITGLHVDPGDTILFQLYGRKHVLLFCPDETPQLGEENPADLRNKFDRAPLQLRIEPSDYRLLRDEVRWSSVQPFNPAKDDLVSFDQATGFEIDIHPGDALYIPDGWWHAVRAIDTAISFSIEPSFDGQLFQ